MYLTAIATVSGSEDSGTDGPAKKAAKIDYSGKAGSFFMGASNTRQKSILEKKAQPKAKAGDTPSKPKAKKDSLTPISAPSTPRDKFLDSSSSEDEDTT